MSEELPSCRFCGEEAICKYKGWNWFVVECTSSDCLARGPIGKTKAEAVKAWYRRAK